jgi:hypothetical protein
MLKISVELMDTGLQAHVKLRGLQSVVSDL